MRLGLFGGILAAFIVTTCLAQQPAPGGSDEKTIWEIWKMHQDQPNNHGSISTNCLEFVKKSPKDPLALVAINLAAWHMLKMDNRDGAVKLFKTSMASTRADPLATAATHMSRTWLTRIDMEHVKQALQLYYRKNIEYPKTLDSIKPFQKDGLPPLVDRWNKPWAYSLSEFQNLKKLGALYAMPGQKYNLRSAMLGTNSDLKASIALPYAGGMPLKPMKVLSGMASKEMIQFESTEGKQTKVVLSIGTDNAGITMCYCGPKLLVLADMNHWLIVPRPY